MRDEIDVGAGGDVSTPVGHKSLLVRLEELATHPDVAAIDRRRELAAGDDRGVACREPATRVERAVGLPEHEAMVDTGTRVVGVDAVSAGLRGRPG